MAVRDLEILPVVGLLLAECRPQFGIAVDFSVTSLNVKHTFDDLHDAGRADGVHVSHKSPGDIVRALPAEVRVTGFDVIASFAVVSDSEVFIGLDTGDRERIVILEEIEIFHGILDAGHSVGVVRRHSGREESRKPGITVRSRKTFTEILVGVFGFVGEQGDLHGTTVGGA